MVEIRITFGDDDWNAPLFVHRGLFLKSFAATDFKRGSESSATLNCFLKTPPSTTTVQSFGKIIEVQSQQRRQVNLRFSIGVSRYFETSTECIADLVPVKQGNVWLAHELYANSQTGLPANWLALLTD